MHSGNISRSRPVSCWPNGRPFRHGAIEIEFVFPPVSKLSAKYDIENFMEDHDFQLGVDYFIPDWNFSGTSMVRSPVYVTFESHEKFFLAKMSWGIDAEQNET